MIRIRKPSLTRDERRALERRRHLRRFRRCEPVDHARPWEKYANRGKPSSIAVQDASRLNRVRLMFDSKVRGIAKAFGIESLGIKPEWLR